jgi:MSHA biogenesis protein MshQ
MTVTMLVMRYMALVAFALSLSVSAEAATYNLSNGQYPPCSSNNWTVSGTTYTCNYGRVELKAGDTVIARTQAVLWAEGGFKIQASTIGSVGNGMVLRASYGIIEISGSSNARSVVYGSVIGANVDLGDTTVKGGVSGSGNAKMVRSSIDGNVEFSNEITLVDTTANGSVISANREIRLTRGRVDGDVTSSGGSGVFIDGTTVEGNISSANVVSIANAKITGNVASSCCKVTVSSSSVVGNISAPGNPIELNDSDVVGTVSNTNRIYLNDSIVYGDVLAATGWGSDVTIRGTGYSRIYGQCAYSGLSPTDLCSDSTDINETLPLYLRFDEVSWRNATVQNSGTLNVTGVASGAAETAGAIPALPGTWGTCRYGEFSGSGRVSVPHNTALNFNDKLSASFWLNVAEFPTSGSVILLGKGHNYRLELDASGRLVLTTQMLRFFSSEDLVISTPISKGWNHVAFTLDYSSSFLVLFPTVAAKLYVNAELKEDQSRTLLAGWGPSTNIEPISIGGNGGNGLRGSMDEVRLNTTLWSVAELSRQAKARHLCGSSSTIDHFEFVTSSGAHTCRPHTVTLKACTNAAPAACQLYPGTVSVTLTGNGWVGGSNKSLVNGIGTFQLQGLQLQMPLGLSASLPVSTNQTLCQIGSASLSSACVLNFSQSGFIFDVPNMLANQGVHKIPIKAVIDRGNPGSPRCEPAFTDEDVPRNIKFWSEFISPAGSELAVSSETVWLNGEAVAQSFAAAEPLPLYFNGDGISHIDVNYREAGKMQLNAHYAGSGNEGDSGVMIGSDDFVSAPAGFCITPEESCSSGDSNCPAFRQVGQPFEVTIRPVAWNAGDNICAGMTTRNYRQNDLKLEPVLVAPAASDNSGEVLVPATRSYDHTTPGSATAWNGEITQNVAFSEVGVFRLQVAPPIDAYFGVTVPSSASEPIGRFYPTHLKVDGEGALTAGCGVFSYQDQPIDIATPLTLTITGYGRVDGGGEYITENYDYDGFWKFEDRPAEVWTAADRELDLSDRLSLDDDGVTERGQNDRDGKRTYTWDAKRLSYTRSALPTAGDLPFSIRQRFSAAELTDKDGVCYDLGTSCQAFEQTIADSEIRLGRLRIANAHGSEQLPLALPWMIESWQVPGVFLPEEGDICSASDWSEPDLIEPTGDLAAIPAPKVSTIKAGHQGVLTVAAPEVTGSGRVGFPKVPKWLWYDWRGEGREPSRGLATFGIYQGPKPLIFRREVYR